MPVEWKIRGARKGTKTWVKVLGVVCVLTTLWAVCWILFFFLPHGTDVHISTPIEVIPVATVPVTVTAPPTVRTTARSTHRAPTAQKDIVPSSLVHEVQVLGERITSQDTKLEQQAAQLHLMGANGMTHLGALRVQIATLVQSLCRSLGAPTTSEDAHTRAVSMVLLVDALVMMRLEDELSHAESWIGEHLDVAALSVTLPQSQTTAFFSMILVYISRCIRVCMCGEVSA